MSTLDGVGSIDTIDAYEGDSGLLVRLTKEIDLDDLLLHLAAQWATEFENWRLDEPTSLPGYSFRGNGDGRVAQVGWFRKAPCNDGEHSWDMAFVSDEKPQGSKARGAFLGVFFG